MDREHATPQAEWVNTPVHACIRGEEAVARSLRRFELLAEIAGKLLQAPEPQKVVDSLCRKVMEYLDCHAFFNFLVDERAGRLRLNACAGIPEEAARRIEWLEYGAAVCGCAARDGCRIVAEHILDTPDPRTDLVRSYGIQAYACHPLMGPGGKVLGTLSFGTRSRETFRDDDLSLMKAVADQVAVAMVRMQDEKQLKEWNETLERRVAERTAEAEQRALQLRALASELSQAEQRERKRIAQLLHDHFQQLLVGAKFDLSVLGSQVREPGLSQDMDRVQRILDDAIEASRSLAVELSPPVLHDAGLLGGLAWLGRWMQEKHGLAVEVKADPEAEPPDEDVRIVLFTAVQELLLNVVKHAKARSAWIEAGRRNGHQVCIRVRDDGIGFEPFVSGGDSRATGGFGLFSIRERLGGLGGSLEIRSGAGQGTEVVLCAAIREAKKEPSSGAAGRADRVEGARAAEPAGEAGAEEPKIRVVLADDHQVVRDGLSRLLQMQPGIVVVGQASDGLEAVECVERVRPDVVIMDITMPRMSGIEATRCIVERMPDVRVIGLSMHSEGEMAGAMRKAGARAFVTKTSSPDVLVDAIRAAAC